jgi:monoamine oxidase
MGCAIRIVFRFRTPFWEELKAVDGQSRATSLGFLAVPQADLPVWWTLFPLRAPLLTAWVGGPRAAALAEFGRDELFSCALAGLSRELGISRARIDSLLTDVWYHDWQHDPLARGAYSYGVVGGGDAPGTLAQPLAGTLFLAGEHTVTDGRSGTVHGALASGQRAAKAVLNHLS